MEPPKTWQDLGIWLAMQFPVLGATALIVWWLLRWSDKKHDKDIARLDAQYEKRLAEKDQRINDLKAEREREVKKLESEIKELKDKLSRSRRPRDNMPEKDTGAEDEKGVGETKP